MCGNGPVQLSPRVSQHRRIALLSMKLTIVFTYSPSPPTTHHPKHYSYTYEEQLNTNIYILDGRFCEKYSVRLSLSHYQILGSNVSPSSAICAGLSLLIVFAGGVGSVWRVEVVEVSTQTNDEDLKITVNIIATGYDEDNDSIV